MIKRKKILMIGITLILLAQFFYGCSYEENHAGNASETMTQENEQNYSKEEIGENTTTGNGSMNENRLSLPSKESIFQNDFIFYTINCGTKETSSLQSTYPMGLFQSVTDQEYGIDDVAKSTWGYLPADFMEAEGNPDSTELTDTKWVIKEGTQGEGSQLGFTYQLQIPEGDYEVTFGFYNPFSARTVDVEMEGVPAIDSMKILKYRLSEVKATQTVTDGYLDIFVHNKERGTDAMKNPILSYIIVRYLPDIDADYLAMLLEKVSTAVEDEMYYTSESYEIYYENYKAAEQAKNNEITDKIREVYTALENSFEGLEKITVYDSFLPGKVWTDTDGTFIQAHGGQVQQMMVPDENGELVEMWYWVGEDKTMGYRGGICAYISDDLYNWTFKGVIMKTVTSREELETESYFTSLYQGYSQEQLDNVYRSINDSTSVIERPKLIYNEKTNQYILWFHADGPTQMSDSNYAAASAGVAVSASPFGPFRFIDRYRLNTCPENQEDMYPQSKGMSRDMNLFVDKDGTAYIVYSSEENLTMYISKLNEEYTYLATDPEEAVEGVDFVRLFPGAQREAPALFERDGFYYLLTSGATGWTPNRARYAMADSIFGEWKEIGDPCVGDTKATTFDSQSTCVFKDESGNYIYMGDRWNSEDLTNSSYIWLPITFKEDKTMELSWSDEWKLEN